MSNLSADVDPFQRIPIFDNRGEDLFGHFESAIAFIKQAKFYGNILVHCHQG
jgi:protein-tyrosine phosphatase